MLEYRGKNDVGITIQVSICSEVHDTKIQYKHYTTFSQCCGSSHCHSAISACGTAGSCNGGFIIIVIELKLRRIWIFLSVAIREDRLPSNQPWPSITVSIEKRSQCLWSTPSFVRTTVTKVPNNGVTSSHQPTYYSDTHLLLHRKFSTQNAIVCQFFRLNYKLYQQLLQTDLLFLLPASSLVAVHKRNAANDQRDEITTSLYFYD